MLSLSPAKLLVLLVVALIVLGPEKLPQVARQLGAAWGDFRRFRTRLESDVRGAFPDLPATHEVAQAVRSPLAFLDRLADEHEKAKPGGEDADGPQEVVASSSTDPPPPDPPPTGPSPGASSNGHTVADTGPAGPGRGIEVGALHPVVPDDPSMN
jgi:TatA/E family protein of Tat protein translocase